MKKIRLSIKEFYLFKNIANFVYDYVRRKNSVIIYAKIEDLELIGY